MASRRRPWAYSHRINYRWNFRRSFPFHLNFRQVREQARAEERLQWYSHRPVRYRLGRRALPGYRPDRRGLGRRRPEGCRQGGD